MPFTSRITGPCVIIICEKKSTNWKTVTQDVISKAQANNALPNYINIGDTICLNCYNGITQGLARFQNVQTSIEQTETDEIGTNVDYMERSETDETENANPLSFSKVVKVMTNILYIRENRKEPTIYTFERIPSSYGKRGCQVKKFF
ncbi:hypothetical protein C2G38_2137971 [Gigaspora rosea]|uniref:Uncharacterized protein n=1 Tax=Gigaspora rosea TaxID=44941 RepID=A0A397VWY4_9GLOM|nr:hypothetical protein C2G38_2137971 [Gigaspora rosea]